MKGKSKKILSTMLALAMVLSLFAAMPLTAYAALAAPSNLVLGESTTDGITIEWQNNSTIAFGIDISRKEGSGDWDDNYGNVNANVTEFTDEDVERGKSYTYRVRVVGLVSISPMRFENSAWSNELTVTVPGSYIITTRPTITGPTAMSLAAGYAATSTDVYTIGGLPSPTVTKTSGDAAITWNDSTKKLDIAAGLAAGSYPVVLTATRGSFSPTLTFTLTVTAAAATPPTISGPTAMSLAAGYAATSTGAYTIGGNPAPTVTKTSGNAAITWDDAAKKLNIAAGLAAGSYPVVLTAASGANSATINFTLTVTATPPAAGAGSMGNFLQANTYRPGQFTDVNESQWYGFNQQKSVATAFEYGLMKGNSDTTFNPTGNMSIAEAIAVAARVHSIYMTGTANFTQGTPWYQVYIDYAVSKGIIESRDFTNFTRAATRAEMAYIFSRSLLIQDFQKKNTVNSLPDVKPGFSSSTGQALTPHYNQIITLYEAGVVGGDASGAFFPNNNINRAEAAAIISRVILPSMRITGKTYNN